MLCSNSNDMEDFFCLSFLTNSVRMVTLYLTKSFTITLVISLSGSVCGALCYCRRGLGLGAFVFRGWQVLSLLCSFFLLNIMTLSSPAFVQKKSNSKYGLHPSLRFFFFATSIDLRHLLCFLSFYQDFIQCSHKNMMCILQLICLLFFVYSCFSAYIVGQEHWRSFLGRHLRWTLQPLIMMTAKLKRIYLTIAERTP
jgi:hypothetical protein